MLKTVYCCQNPVLLRYRREWIDTRGGTRGLLLLKCAHGFRRPIAKIFSCCKQGGAVAYVVGSLCSPPSPHPQPLQRLAAWSPGAKRAYRAHTSSPGATTRQLPFRPGGWCFFGRGVLCAALPPLGTLTHWHPSLSQGQRIFCAYPTTLDLSPWSLYGVSCSFASSAPLFRIGTEWGSGGVDL